MKRNIIIIITGIIILNIAGAIYFTESMRDRSFRLMQRFMEERLVTPEMIDRISRDLELDPGQVDAVKAIYEKYEAQMKPYRDRLKPLHGEMGKTMFQEGAFDEKKIRKLMEDIDHERREIRILTMKQRVEMEKIFTPEQKKKHYERLHGMEKRFKKGFFPDGPPDGHGHPPGPPPDFFDGER